MCECAHAWDIAGSAGMMRAHALAGSISTLTKGRQHMVTHRNAARRNVACAGEASGKSDDAPCMMHGARHTDTLSVAAHNIDLHGAVARPRAHAHALRAGAAGSPGCWVAGCCAWLVDGCCAGSGLHPTAVQPVAQCPFAAANDGGCCSCNRPTRQRQLLPLQLRLLWKLSSAAAAIAVTGAVDPLLRSAVAVVTPTALRPLPKGVTATTAAAAAYASCRTRQHQVRLSPPAHSTAAALKLLLPLSIHLFRLATRLTRLTTRTESALQHHSTLREGKKERKGRGTHTHTPTHTETRGHFLTQVLTCCSCEGILSARPRVTAGGPW